MPSNQVSEFVFSVLGCLHLILESIKDPPGFIAEKIEKNIGFIFEINIDGAVRYTGGLGDLRNGRLMVSLFRKHFDSGIKDLVVFVIIGSAGFFLIFDDTPLCMAPKTMNEPSFIE
jgi:hypothetical protein